VSPLWGEKKTIFGPLSKNNTGMAARLWDYPHTSIHSWVGTVGIVGEWAAVWWAKLRSALSPDWSLN